MLLFTFDNCGLINVLIWNDFFVPKFILFFLYLMVVGGFFPKRERNDMHLWEWLPVIALAAYFEIRGSVSSYFATLALILTFLNIILYIAFNKKLIGKKQLMEIVEISIFRSSGYAIILTPLVYISIIAGNLWYLPTIIIVYILLATIIWRLLQVAKFFKVVIYLRIIILAMLLTILITYMSHCVILLKNIDEFFVSAETVVLSFSAIFTAIAIISGLLFSINMFKHIFFSKYNNEFVLFLRCFKFDNSTQYNEVIHSLIQIFKGYYNVLRVGNPKDILKGDYDYDTMYLPKTNWQEVVESYITRAKVILLVIDNTNGVLWEMLKHCNNRAKYIYYLPLDANIDKIISAPEFQKENKKGNPITRLFLINKDSLKKGHYFFFHEDRIVASDIIFDVIAEYVSTHNVNHKDCLLERCIQYLSDPPIPHKPRESLINILSNIDIKSLYKL